jgi:hypothetical protein
LVTDPALWGQQPPYDTNPKRVGAPGDVITFSANLDDGIMVDSWDWQFPENVTLLTAQGQSVNVRLDSGGGTFPGRLITTNAAGSSEWEFSIIID